MEITRLAGCVIADAENQVLLLHRIDHGQWQLPGGRRQLQANGTLEDPLDTVVREAYDELCLEVQPWHARWLGYTVFRQGVVNYSCEWYKVEEFGGEPFLQQPELYDDWDYVNLFKYRVGKIALSPNVEQLRNRLQKGSIEL